MVWFSEKDVEVELDVLSYASTVAYGGVTYLKCISIDENKVVCSFVMSISQLALIKEPTLRIPRFELQAPVLAWISSLECKIMEVFTKNNTKHS